MEQEYDLVRYDRLRLVCQKALEQVIKRSLSVDQVYQCFPELALSPEGRKALETAQQQLVTYWHRTGLREFDLIFSEFGVEPKLRALDRVIARAQQRKADPGLIPALVDLKTAPEIIDATLVAHSQPLIAHLRKVHADLALDNETMRTQLKSLHTESLHVAESTSAALDTLKAHVEALRKESEKTNYITEFLIERCDEVGQDVA